MAIEIERKFLVDDPDCIAGLEGERYVQAYLSTDPARTVRVRIAGRRAFLTIKGAGDGISRPEFEYPIPPEDAATMMKLCTTSPLEKTRYRLQCHGLCWEIDVFGGDNQGLMLAEVELGHAEQRLELPRWVGREVSDDPRYSNSSLAVNPYRRWSQV